MTVTVADNRTLVDEADSLTDWSSPVGAEALTLFTADPDPVETTGCIGMAISTETGEVVHTISPSVDLSAGFLIYVWTLANGTMDTLVNGGVTITIGDGTNIIGYHLGGSDAAGFRYEEGLVGWQCLIIDSGSLPSNFTEYAGSEASLDWTAITQFGAGYKTLSKALGGASNCFTDVIRYGNGGLTITGTVTTTLFDEIYVADRVNTAAYGIVRKIGEGLYSIQGQLIFGDNAGTVASTLTDDNVVAIFEDRDISTSKYGITVVGNATGSTTFQLGTKVGSENGTDGCIVICPAGIGAFFLATDTDLQYVKLYGSTFRGFEQGFDFSTDPTNAPNHEIFDCQFVGCDMIDIGKTTFKNNAIIATIDADGGMLISSTTSLANVSGLSFTSDGTGHAIYITATGSYTFTNFTYSGYGASGTTDAVIYNNSGGAVTINVVGGDTPTYRNGAGASTSVVASVNLKVTVKDALGNAIVGARVLMEAGDDSGAAPFEESVTITRVDTTATVAHTAHGLATGQMVTIRGALQPEYNGAGKVITVTGVDEYTYQVSGAPATPATGTITSTQCFMSELTISGGIAEEAFNSAGAQTYRGRVAKASAAPYWKDVTFSGADCSGGLDLPIQMASDQ